MPQLVRAAFIVHWHQRDPQEIPVQYNPTDLTYDKTVQVAEINIPGLDSPLQQFIRGNSEKLTIKLFFDTTDEGMGSRTTSVTTLTDRIYQLVKIEPTRHAPPICTFVWNANFPGSSLGGSSSNRALGAAAMAAGEAAEAASSAAASTPAGQAAAAIASQGAPSLGNQRRNGFKCIVENIKQEFSLFSPQGVPLRATLTVTLREYKTLDDQLRSLNRTSPDRTHSHVLGRGETLSSVSGQYYQRPGDWRAIAEANGIEDPRRLTPGLILTVPLLSPDGSR